jgi:hypothetical protein
VVSRALARLATAMEGAEREGTDERRNS